MFYVSFAQVPKAAPLDGSSKLWMVKFSVRVTTDLKERELSSPITFNVSIVDEKPGTRQIQGSLHVQRWTPKHINDVCKIEFRTPQTLESHRITLRVSASGEREGRSPLEDVMYDIPDVPLQSNALPPIVSVHSATLELDERATSTPLLQYRKLVGPEASAPRLKMWEDLGNSLARHMWDGGIAMAAWLDMIMRAGVDPIVPTKTLPRLHVLEIGCGIGTVGIHLAQLVPSVSVTLTDLADAREMADMNIKEARLAKGSEVSFDVMDWEQDACPETYKHNPVDLIIISECFYNTNMADSLVNKLLAIMSLHKENVQAPVLVSWKCRHPDEQLFKSLMEQHFNLTYQDSIPLPEAEPGVNAELDPLTEEPIAANVLVYRHPARQKLAGDTLDRCPAKVRHLPLRFLWNEPSPW